jgi:hypothetical protein
MIRVGRRVGAPPDARVIFCCWMGSVGLPSGSLINVEF